MSTTQTVLVAIPAGVALAVVALAGVAIRGRRKLERQLRDNERTRP